MPDAVQIINPTREQPRDLTGFDFNALAEMYPSCSKKCRGRVTYKRFDTGAEALRFAVDRCPKLWEARHAYVNFECQLKSSL